jgi:hypothetical protein
VVTIASPATSPKLSSLLALAVTACNANDKPDPNTLIVGLSK